PYKAINNIVNKPDFSYNITDNANTMFLQPFAKEELLTILSSKLKNKWSSGPNSVPPAILKKVLPAIIDALTHLVNLSFNEGKFPEKIKKARVLSLNKKKNRNIPSNYRPVSLCYSFSQIFGY